MKRNATPIDNCAFEAVALQQIVNPMTADKAQALFRYSAALFPAHTFEILEEDDAGQPTLRVRYLPSGSVRESAFEDEEPLCVKASDLDEFVRRWYVLPGRHLVLDLAKVPVLFWNVVHLMPDIESRERNIRLFVQNCAAGVPGMTGITQERGFTESENDENSPRGDKSVPTHNGAESSEDLTDVDDETIPDGYDDVRSPETITARIDCL